MEASATVHATAQAPTMPPPPPPPPPSPPTPTSSPFPLSCSLPSSASSEAEPSSRSATSWCAAAASEVTPGQMCPRRSWPHVRHLLRRVSPSSTHFLASLMRAPPAAGLLRGSSRQALCYLRPLRAALPVLALAQCHTREQGRVLVEGPRHVSLGRDLTLQGWPDYRARERRARGRSHLPVLPLRQVLGMGGVNSSFGGWARCLRWGWGC